MSNEQRPTVAIGHVGPIRVRSLTDSIAFYEGFGMRVVGNFGAMAILELRGGTHLLLRQGSASPGSRLPFDLMVDDIATARQTCLTNNLSPSPIRRGGVHSGFEVRDPDGHVVPVVSSHAVGVV